MMAALSLGLAIATGWAAARRLLDAPADLASRILRAGLAVPLGLGSTSLLSYAWLAAGGSLGPAYVVTESLLLVAAFVALRPWVSTPAARADAAPPSSGDRVAVAVAALATVLAAVAFVQTTVVMPFGEWDAWAIWNNHARFLYRGGDGWRAVLDPLLGYSHNEYPLLLPAAVARLWAYSGETTPAPALIAAAFAFSVPLVVHGATARRAGHVAGATATLLLLAAASWGRQAAMQFADVPLACFVVAAVACVAARRRDEPRTYRGLALAGVFLGLGAWTKDEGVLLGGLFGAWAVLEAGRRGASRRAVALAAGAAIPLAERLHFQAISPPFATSFTSGLTASTALGRLLDPARWATIFAEVPSELPGSETWLPAVAVGMAVLLGLRWRELLRSPAVPALLASAAYLVIYSLTPSDLRWHIKTSACRIFVQPWPALLVGLFWTSGSRASEAAASAPPTDAHPATSVASA